MSVKYEELEHNLVKITVEISAEDVDKAQEKVYLNNRSKISIPGFRKGKVPRKLIEQTYGKDVFLEDAVNEIVPEAYQAAVEEIEKEHDIKVASYPDIDYGDLASGQPVVFVATVAKKPEVVLGEYKGLEVESETVEVTEDDIAAELKKEQEKNSTINPVEGRPVQNDDMITLDFCGKVDGVEFEGGKAEDYPLTIGSHSFIDGFEEQLVGMNVGETKDINVTFPEKYQAENLAGKPAVFTCTIKSIKERQLPELDDEFASEVSDFETFAEYKEDVKKKLLAAKEDMAKQKKENALLEKAVENAEMDIPEIMVNSEARISMQDFAQRLEAQGLDMQQYMQFIGMTEEQMIENQKEASLKSIKSRLVLEAIVKAENIVADDADVEAEMVRMGENYGLDLEKMKSVLSEDQVAELKSNVETKKALELLVANAK